MRDSYRISGPRLAVTVGTVAAPGLLLFHNRDDVPTGWLAVGWLVLATLVLLPTIRPTTTISADGVVVRRAVRTTAHPWREIADIRFEQVTSPFSRVAVRGAVLYDAELRRVELPHLSEGRLGGAAAAKLATAELRERWAAARGASWRARTAEVDQLVRTRHARNRVWRAALAAAGGGLLLALLIIALVAQAWPDALEVDEPHGPLPLLALLLPVLAFTITATVGLRRHRGR